MLGRGYTGLHEGARGPTSRHWANLEEARGPTSRLRASPQKRNFLAVPLAASEKIWQGARGPTSRLRAPWKRPAVPLAAPGPLPRNRGLTDRPKDFSSSRSHKPPLSYVSGRNPARLLRMAYPSLILGVEGVNHWPMPFTPNVPGVEEV